MKTKSKLKKATIIIIAIILLVLILYRLSLALLSADVILSGDKYNTDNYYSTPDECITHTLELQNSYMSSDGFNRDKTLYVYEDDKQYVEFFIADNEYDIWFFTLEKESIDGKVQYSVSKCENCVQLHLDEWHTYDGFAYNVVSDFNNITYNGIEPDITDVKINTISGYEQLYLLFVKE